MQAMGQLAGGIAHDFNNLLTAMIGFCDLLLQRHSIGDSSYADIIQIKQNANCAAELVRQLLQFSRKQPLKPELNNITDILVNYTLYVSIRYPYCGRMARVAEMQSPSRGPGDAGAAPTIY